MNDDVYKAIYNKALDILSRREHSQKELTEKLIKKFDKSELIDTVLYSLLEKNLINDTRFSEAYVAARKRKGFGPKKILFELISKGINENTANEVIDAEGYWKEAALIVFSKKYKTGIDKDFKEQNKQKIFLQNRGFSFEEIDSVFT
jgi:regulatory protein